MWNSEIIVAGFILTLAFSSSAEAKLYKWVDDNGNTHYGEVIPPEYAAKDKEQPGKSSLRSKNVEILSPEIISAKEEEVAKNNAAKKEMEEKKRRDTALRNTYSSEKEIDQALERSLVLINARIESNNVLLKSSQSSLDSLKMEVDTRTKEGKKIPQSLYDDISLTEAKVTKYQLERTKSEEVLISTKARFENDKILYRKIPVVNPNNISEKNSAQNYPEAGDYYDSSDYGDSYSRNRKSKSRGRY